MIQLFSIIATVPRRPISSYTAPTAYDTHSSREYWQPTAAPTYSSYSPAAPAPVQYSTTYYYAPAPAPAPYASPRVLLPPPVSSYPTL